MMIDRAMNNLAMAFAALLAMSLASCQSAGPYKSFDSSILEQVQTELEQSRDAASLGTRVVPPQQVLNALVPQIAFSEDDAAGVDARFDFSVKDAMPVREFFSLLTADTDYSVVVHPDVKGSVSALDLKNVTVQDVLDQIIEIYGYSIRLDDGVYQIRPGGLQTRIFKLNYLNVTRSGSSTMQVTASGISEGSQNRNSYGGGQMANVNPVAGGQGGYNNNQNNQNSGRATIQTETETDYWKDLETVIRSIIGSGSGPSIASLSGSESRSVIVSPQTGMILVRAFPKELKEVGEFIEASQAALQRQVVLEAKILEVELSEGFQSGINLQALGDRKVSAAYGSGAIEQSIVGTPLSLNLNFTDFTGVIKLLESQGNVQVISSPRILTLNNQKAIFKVGQESYYLTAANTTAYGQGTGGNVVNSNSNLEPFFSGIALDVTPQISEAGDIILHIHPILSEVKEEVKRILDNDFPLASSATRESDTIARVRNGEVIVISGLMQTRSRGSTSGIPGVDEIPIISRPLEQNERTTVKTELVILLRAMVDEKDVMRQSIDDSLERVKKLRSRIDPFYRGER
jgi:MSHA biogenesis protein MshL